MVFHIFEADVSENTSIVDQDIDAAVGLDGGLNDLIAIGDAVIVGDGLSASGFDLIDDYICGLEFRSVNALEESHPAATR